MKKSALMLAILLISYTTFAAYNSNMSGVIKNIMVYTDGDYIYLRLMNQPISHPTCNPQFFVIDGSISIDRRQMLLSRLMMAYASKENVNIGYDGTGSCANGYIRVHRVG